MKCKSVVPSRGQFCNKHKCEVEECKKSKSSKERYCKQHSKSSSDKFLILACLGQACEFIAHALWFIVMLGAGGG